MSILHVRTVATFACILGLTASAQADILGISDLSQYTVNLSDAQAQPAVINGRLEITNAAAPEARNIFYDVPQQITHFTVSFTYQEVGAYRSVGNGVTFVVQNVPDGAHATSATGTSPGNAALGFADLGGQQGGTPLHPESAAFSLELGASSGAGLYTGGLVATGGAYPTAPLDLFSGDPISVVLSYNRPVMQESLTDTQTGKTFSASFNIDLPTLMHSPTAFVGFTAASSIQSDFPYFVGDQQFISEFTFRTPEPSSIALLGMGAVGLLVWSWRRRRR